MPPRTAPAIGIDLGTTFSCVAHLDAASLPRTIMNAEGEPTTPSVVYFDEQEILVGREAVKAGALDPARVAAFMKREMGNPTFSHPVAGRKFPPEVLQSYVLKKLKQDAEVQLGHVRQAVVTVPAYFDEPRRKRTQDAGRIAGLDVIGILNEPTAASIAFGVQEGFVNKAGESLKKELIVVYDLGGGTFDVTLMEIDGKQYKALATDGDVYLGGLDWDKRIVDHVAAQFMKKAGGGDPREDPEALHHLLRQAEDVKRSLSVREQTPFLVEHGGKREKVVLTRGEFEDMTADLLDRTRFTVTSVLSEAQVSWKQITRLLLVGGSTRMPMVQKMLHKTSGMTPDRSLSADEAVAHGAALYAGMLVAKSAGKPTTMTVQNVCSHNLGVLGIEKATGRPRNQVLIPRNTQLPVTRVSRFQTAKDNQQSVVANVIEGGDASGEASTPIGRCVVRDLPKHLPAGTPVDVAFSYDENGRLTVKAQLPTIGKSATLVVERPLGLSDERVAKWETAVQNAKGPMELGDD